MNVRAKFDEIPPLTFKIFKKKQKCFGQMERQKNNVKMVYPPRLNLQFAEVWLFGQNK